jgi:DNA-binding NtrC family response regulator
MADTMLVIDDEDIVLESCRRIFSAEGFQVTCTTSPREGLRLIENVSFDVILCDWKMPGFDGMDVLAELNQRSPGSAVIMISGYPTVDRTAEAMKRGAMDYVAKPFTPDEIVGAVQKALARKGT